MQKRLAKAARALLAVVLLVAGLYWFLVSAQAWSQEGFAVITEGDKGKTAFSGLLFSSIFMLYGIWDLYMLSRDNRS